MTFSSNGPRALEVHGVEKAFKKRRQDPVRALRGIDLTIEKGEVVGILGPNGSGKSTLVRVISTLITPDAGSVRVFGVDALQHPKAVQEMMNRVSVEASFFKKLSAYENLLYGSKLYGLTSAEAKPKITEILESIGFRMKRANEPMENLSRGMQQKIALARALLTSPMLLLLDEPTTGLDPRSKKDVQAVIWDIRRSHDASILLCTHDMGEAEELCDRIGIIVDGELLALDTADGLKRKYQTGPDIPTLEDVFMAATGTTLEMADKDEDESEQESA
jgi:ABC-2 type transport system ATP-binding protein